MNEQNNFQQLKELTDSVTLSYLKGQITFQEYQSLLENQKLTNDSNVAFNGVIEEELETLQIVEGTSASFSTSGLIPLGQRKRTNSSSSNTNTASKKINSSIDRFLNLQNIMSSNEDEESDDENTNKNTGNLTNNSDNLDLFDDSTSNWNDFDIETLNFDNFIKSNKSSETTESTPATSSKQTKKKENSEQSTQSGAQKRKRDDLDQKDLIEIKSKRRVNKFRITNFGTNVS